MKQYFKGINFGGLLLVAGLATVTFGCATSQENGGSNTVAENMAKSDPAKTEATTSGRGATPNSNNTEVRPVPEKQGKGASSATKMPQPEIGPGGNDLSIYTGVRGAITSHPELRDANIIINVNVGHVTLTGTVSTSAQKAELEKIAKGISGVKSVNNQVNVKGTT